MISANGQWTKIVLALGAILTATMASASTYFTETVGNYTVRCSAVHVDTLPEAVLDRYRVESEPGKGLLSCVVQQADAEGDISNIRAAVHVRIENLMGVATIPVVREVRDGDLVTYLASYDIPVDTQLQFQVTLSPEDSDVTIPLSFKSDLPQE